MQPERGRRTHQFFCPCPRGLEPALAAELAGLGASDIEAAGGGVGCTGGLTLAYRVNLSSRIASRVLLRIAMRNYRREADLYALTVEQRWENFFGARHTLRVDTTAIRSPLKSLNFANLKVKDGIVDRLRERTGDRPSIDTESPDVRVFVFLTERDATLYLDLSGEPLFKRGWRAGRDTKGEAPLKENLAAGLLALSGWQPGQPLQDPFCGAGTILVEAAQIAWSRAPGLDRRFAIEKLALHHAGQWRDLEERARAQVLAPDASVAAPLAGSDIDPAAIAMARANLERAGLPPGAVQLSVADAAAARPPDARPGVLLSNPPYGERVAMDPAVWRAFGATLREHYRHWRALLLTSDRALPGQLGLRERRKTPLFNGAIECRLFEFAMYPPKPAGEPVAAPGGEPDAPKAADA